MKPDPTAIPIQFDPRSRRMEGVAIHGNVPFSVPFMSEIGSNLWMGGCTNGLILPTGIEHLVSLYPWEQYTVAHEIKSVLTVRLYDSLEQALDQVDDIARWVNARREEAPVLVHCQAGLNRSGLVTARALMLGGLTAQEAINLLRAKRSPAVLCNEAFEAYLLGLAE